jgi:hypothetical protein
MSSTSIALMVCAITLSAALTFVDAGVAGSNITFSNTEAAAVDAYCNRPTVAKCGSPRHAVRVGELWQLHPSKQRGGSDADGFGCVSAA